ncbi:MAG: hypothetical protein ABR581_06700 [Thermoleophilaceae bacterium]
MRDSERFDLLLAAVGGVGALLILISEFSTIAAVDVAHGSCKVINDSNPALADRCALSGFERHGGAFLLLGLVALVMAWGAGSGRSRPAAMALIAAGVIVLGFALFSDLPQTGETGAIGRDFADATASPGAGFYMEIVGAVLIIVAGGLRLSRRPED